MPRRGNQSAAEEALTSLLRTRSIVWYDPQTGGYVYRSLGCAFHFPDTGPSPTDQPPIEKPRLKEYSKK
ncbi:MAG TPA: hypothetical protein VI933_02725 [archaeon]|nr:hypothetical protein [archaeon]